jgi:hypothetical protein
MFIWCDFFLDDFDAGRYLLLTPDIDENYLIESPAKIRDPQLLESSLEMKTKYEIKFTQSFLSMQPGDDVEIYGLTFFCPRTSQKNGGNMLTIQLKRIETIKNEETNENEIIAIILKSPADNITIKTEQDNNNDDVKKVVEEEEEEEEFRFTQKVHTEYGRYGGVKLWSIEDASIIPSEDPHTYIICSSELFY